MKPEFQNIESKCYVKIVEIEGIKTITTINKENNHHTWNKEMVAPLNEVWKNFKFIKAEEPKPVSTAEAFKALDEGKIIESVISKDKYKKINGIIHIEKEDGDTGRLMYIYRNELEGQWLIHE